MGHLRKIEESHCVTKGKRAKKDEKLRVHGPAKGMNRGRLDLFVSRRDAIVSRHFTPPILNSSQFIPR